MMTNYYWKNNLYESTNLFAYFWFNVNRPMCFGAPRCVILSWLQQIFLPQLLLPSGHFNLQQTKYFKLYA